MDKEMIIRIINAAILVMEVIWLTDEFRERGKSSLFFYTVLSNIFVAVSSLLVLILGMTPITVYVRYLACCVIAMTSLVTAFILVPMGGSVKKLLFTGRGLFLHLLIPVISVCSYIFLEDHVPSVTAVAVSAMITLAYGIVMYFLNYIGKVDGPYPFFHIKEQTPLVTAGWVIALISIISIISYLLYIS